LRSSWSHVIGSGMVEIIHAKRLGPPGERSTLASRAFGASNATAERTGLSSETRGVGSGAVSGSAMVISGAITTLMGRRPGD
jgi:hypothetical protein